MTQEHLDAVRDTSKRRWFAVGAVLAGVVALVFATVGDGVEVPDAEGVRRLVVDHAHTVTWVLLAAALGVAALRGAWDRASQVLAIAAGACYAAFLAGVFLLG